ncbi:MAG: hypothetical protein AB7V58_09105 [Solirubrobacterales bacterium]
MDRRGAYQGAIRTFSALFVAIGLLLLVVTLANGGGPLSIGFLLGLAFLAVGVLRLWLVTRSGR